MKNITKFQIRFLEPAKIFIESLDNKTREKILFNLWKSRNINDPGLLKKLSVDIWEFRTRFNGKQYRLLAFWDKNDNNITLVIATDGFVKKRQKTPKREMEKAKQLRKEYFDNI